MSESFSLLYITSKSITIILFLIAGIIYNMKASYHQKQLAMLRNQNAALREQRLEEIILHKTVQLNNISTIVAFVSVMCGMATFTEVMVIPFEDRKVNMFHFIDTIITSPIIQMQLGVLADVDTSRVVLMGFNVFAIQLYNLFIAVSSHYWRYLYLVLGIGHGVYMTKDMDFILRHQTRGHVSLIAGRSWFRLLCWFAIAVWVVSWVFGLISADGLNLAQFNEHSEEYVSLVASITSTSLDVMIAVLESKIVLEVAQLDILATEPLSVCLIPSTLERERLGQNVVSNERNHEQD